MGERALAWQEGLTECPNLQTRREKEKRKMINDAGRAGMQAGSQSDRHSVAVESWTSLGSVKRGKRQAEKSRRHAQWTEKSEA